MPNFWAAIAAGVAVGILYFPYGRYHYWWTWIAKRSIVGLVGYVVVSGLAGLLGWWVGRVSHWRPTQNAFLGGITLGAAGQVAVRARFALPGKGDIAGGGSLLSLAINWMPEVLDARTDNAIKDWAGLLSAKQLKIRSWDAYEEHMKRDQSISEAVKKEFVADIEESIALIDNPNENAQIRGTASLKAMIWKVYVEYREPKPR